jgi:hypothetical protein
MKIVIIHHSGNIINKNFHTALRINVKILIIKILINKFYILLNSN